MCQTDNFYDFHESFPFYEKLFKRQQNKNFVLHSTTHFSIAYREFIIAYMKHESIDAWSGTHNKTQKKEIFMTCVRLVSCNIPDICCQLVQSFRQRSLIYAMFVNYFIQFLRKDKWQTKKDFNCVYNCCRLLPFIVYICEKAKSNVSSFMTILQFHGHILRFVSLLF